MEAVKPARPRAIRLRVSSETIRLLAGAEIEDLAIRGGVERPPVGVTEPCITPRCPGDYTADCPA